MSTRLGARSPLHALELERRLALVTVVSPPVAWTPPPHRRWPSDPPALPCCRQWFGGSASGRRLQQLDGPKPSEAPNLPWTRAPSLSAPARRQRTPSCRRRTTPHSARRPRRAFEGRPGDFLRGFRRTCAGPTGDRAPQTRRPTPGHTTHASPGRAPADPGGRSRSLGHSAWSARQTASSHESVRRAAARGSTARPKGEQRQPRCGVSNALV